MAAWDKDPIVSSGSAWDNDPVISSVPVKIGRDAFADTLREELKNTDWATRNIAGAGTALSNLWEGVKQFAGKGDQQAIEANRIIEQEAPIGAIAGNIALTAAPFAMVGNSLKAAGAVGAGLGVLQPVAGDQSLSNVVQGKAINAALGGGLAIGGQAIANKAGTMLQDKLAHLAARRAQNAQRDATLLAAREQGLVIPPDMVNPSLTNRLLTGFAGKLTTQQQASAQNQEAFNTIAKKALGLPDDMPLSDEALAAFRSMKAGPYKEIQALGELPVDDAYALGKMGPQVFGKAKPQTVFTDEYGRVVSDVAPMPKAEQSRNLLNDIIKAGGIAKSELSDMGIEGVKRPGLFRREGAGNSADDIVEWMTQRGWLSADDVAMADKYKPGGSHDLARSMLKDAIEGKPVFHPEDAFSENEFARQLSEWGGKYGNLAKKTIPGDPGKVSAADAIERLKELRHESKDYWKFFNRTGDPKARKAAKAYDSAAEQLEQFIDRSAQKVGRSDLIPSLQEARKAIAKAHTVGKALNDATGNINPKVLAREKYLTGDLKTAADFAKAFPKAAQSVEQIGSLPGMSPLDFVSGAAYGSIGHAAAGGPAGLLAAGVPFVRPIARNILLSDIYQALAAKPNYTLGMLPRVAGRSLQYAPIGATALGLETLGK